jgi:hypothetical protein
MSGSRAFIAAFAVALSFASAGTAAAYHTRFVADNCNAAAPTPTSYITRDGSATVALRGRYEGYQWGGRRYALSHYATDRVHPCLGRSR